MQIQIIWAVVHYVGKFVVPVCFNVSVKKLDVNLCLYKFMIWSKEAGLKQMSPLKETFN